MKLAVRLLTVLLLVEAVACGWLVSTRLSQAAPVIPTFELDDPLFGDEIAELASKAQKGGEAEWKQLAEALMSHGYYSHAEQNFLRALKLNPENAHARFGLAFCLDKMGRLEQSTAEYRRFLSTETGTAEKKNMNYYALYSIGKNFLREEKMQDAEASFRENEGFVPAQYQLAKLLIRSERAEQALPIIEKNLKELPLSLEFHYLNAIAMDALDRPEQAKAAADMIERSAHLVTLNFNNDYINPFYYQYGLAKLFNECDMLQKQNKIDPFEKKMKLILETMQGARHPKYPTALYQLMLVAEHRNQPEQMLHFLDEMEKVKINSSQILFYRGKAYAMQGKNEQAAAFWQQSLELFPNAEVHHNLAVFHRQKKDDQKVKFHLGKEKLLTGIALYRQNQLEGARRELELSISINPNDPFAWYYLGEINHYLGDDERAERAYHRCLKISPYHGRALDRVKKKS